MPGTARLTYFSVSDATNQEEPEPNARTVKTSCDGGIEIGDNRMETLGLFETDVVPAIVDDVKAAFGSLPKLTNGRVWRGSILVAVDDYEWLGP